MTFLSERDSNEMLQRDEAVRASVEYTRDYLSKQTGPLSAFDSLILSLDIEEHEKLVQLSIPPHVREISVRIARRMSWADIDWKVDGWPFAYCADSVHLRFFEDEKGLARWHLLVVERMDANTKELLMALPGGFQNQRFLTQRFRDMVKPWSAKQCAEAAIALPPQSELPVTTAVRESTEETGVNYNNDPTSTFFSYYGALRFRDHTNPLPDGSRRTYCSQPFLVASSGKKLPLRASSEGTPKWVPMDDFLGSDKTYDDHKEMVTEGARALGRMLPRELPSKPNIDSTTAQAMQAQLPSQEIQTINLVA